MKFKGKGKQSIALAESGTNEMNGMGSLLAPIISFITKMLVITELEVRKLRHDPTELITRAIQPVLWLLVFGMVITQARAIPTGNLPYIDFLTPGVLAQSVLFVSIFYGISIIWERDLGIVQKFLAAPIPRTALVAGKALSAGIRGLAEASIIYLLALVLGVGVILNPLSIICVIFVIIIGAALFSTLSLIIACLVKTRERFMGIGQMITMPLFFTSNAIYPIALMPEWLKIIAHGNPLTYMVDALRALMIDHGISEYGLLTDFGILIVMAIILIIIGARLYPRVIR